MFAACITCAFVCLQLEGCGPSFRHLNDVRGEEVALLSSDINGDTGKGKDTSRVAVRVCAAGALSVMTQGTDRQAAAHPAE